MMLSVPDDLPRKSRRHFLLASGAFLQGTVSRAVSMGVIGAGGRGTFVMGVFQKDAAVRVNAICDIYEPNLERGLAAAAKAQGGVVPKAYRNYRELLDDKSIDAVLIASPEHWHHRMVLDALAAGKDVYVEKPLCHTPVEGVELVEAEKRTKQIIQVGMQRRSYDLFQEGRKVVAGGALGAVRMVRTWWLNTQLGGEKVSKLEGKLDWEQFIGPAPRREFDPDLYKRWRMYSEYSGGIVADQGAHIYDGIHMLMGSGAPLAVTAAAGRPHAVSGDTPESVVVTAEYPEDFIATFAINYAAMKYQFSRDQMNHLDGDKARMDIGRDEYKVFVQGSEDQPAFAMKSEKGFGYATDLHVMNFLESVRTRKTPTAPMRLGFQSALVVQLANISLKTGKRIRWNATKNQVEV